MALRGEVDADPKSPLSLVSSNTDVEAIQKYFGERFDNVENLIKTTIPTMKKDIEDLRRDAKDIRSSVTALETRVDIVERGDPNAIEIHGLPSIDVKQRYAAAEELIKFLDTDFHEGDIDHCVLVKRRLGAKSVTPVTSADGSATKNPGTGSGETAYLLIVRFVTRRLGERAMECWRKITRAGQKSFKVLEHSGLRIHMCERISPSTRGLLRRARETARERGWMFVWVRDGRIFARRSEREQYLTINSLKDLEKLQ